MSMIDICGNIKLTKVIKIAGNYLENGDIVKLTYRDGVSTIGELQIDNESDSICIKTINNMYATSIFDRSFFSIEKVSEVELLMWKLRTDSELQKKLVEITTNEMECKSRLERQIQELKEQL